jgi:hypothetical protein
VFALSCLVTWRSLDREVPPQLLQKSLRNPENWSPCETLTAVAYSSRGISDMEVKHGYGETKRQCLPYKIYRNESRLFLVLPESACLIGQFNLRRENFTYFISHQQTGPQPYYQFVSSSADRKAVPLELAYKLNGNCRGSHSTKLDVVS